MNTNRRRVMISKNITTDFVDLGLPSGTLWAFSNLVKENGVIKLGSKREEDGCLFSWGNIDGWNDDEYNFNDTNYNSSTGVNLQADITTSANDAARAHLGGNWRMPSKDDFTELFNTSYCTRSRVAVNGRYGFLFTSVSNGNTLFLPSAGCRDGIGRSVVDTTCYYWTATYNNAGSAWDLYTKNTSVYTNDASARRLGLSIRPVC